MLCSVRPFDDFDLMRSTIWLVKGKRGSERGATSDLCFLTGTDDQVIRNSHICGKNDLLANKGYF